MTPKFSSYINNRKISTLCVTGASKSVISEKYLQRIHGTDKVHPCTGIRLSFTSGSNISPIGILILSIGIGVNKFKQNFMVCINLRRSLILGLDFHHKFHIGTSLDSDGKPFFHKDGNPIVYTRTQKSLVKIYTIEYQEIQTYNTMIIKSKLDPSTVGDQDNYLLSADSTLIQNNPNLKCHP